MARLANRAIRLLRPPGWALALAALASGLALGCVFASGRTRCLPAYLAYLLSAYSLAAALAALPGLVRRVRGALAGSAPFRRALALPAVGRYLADPAFRAGVSVCQGMAANLLYAAFCALVAAWSASAWYASLAAYHLALGGMRAQLVVCYRRRAAVDERRCYRRTAWLLFVLSVPMGGMTAMMVLTDPGCAYPGSVIYLFALYAFCSMALAVVNLVRSRRLDSPVLSASRVLGLVSAAVSILGLQAALISRFSESAEAYRQMMNALTGGCVYGAVIVIAVCMLLGDRRERREGVRR